MVASSVIFPTQPRFIPCREFLVQKKKNARVKNANASVYTTAGTC